MFTLIENGDVYGPEPLGRTSVLLVDEKIQKIGDVDTRAIEKLAVPFEVIDASGCFVIPGLIDPHQHLLGGSGEEGFSSQTPEIGVEQIVTAGITTVVGCLGVDTTMKTMPRLLARAVKKRAVQEIALGRARGALQRRTRIHGRGQTRAGRDRKREERRGSGRGGIG